MGNCIRSLLSHLIEFMCKDCDGTQEPNENHETHIKQGIQSDNNNDIVKTCTDKPGVLIRDERGEDNAEKSKTGLNGLRNKTKSYSENTYADFANEVSSRRVCLEDIFIDEREVSLLIAISGNEHHADLANENNSKVTVRYTTDSWESVSNTDALPFAADENNNKAFQRFFSVISVPKGRSFEFAIRNIGESGVSWDNNNHGNYRVENMMEDEGLVAKFVPLKQAMVESMDKSVALKEHASKD